MSLVVAEYTGSRNQEPQGAPLQEITVFQQAQIKSWENGPALHWHGVSNAPPNAQPNARLRSRWLGNNWELFEHQPSIHLGQFRPQAQGTGIFGAAVIASSWGIGGPLLAVPVSGLVGYFLGKNLPVFHVLICRESEYERDCDRCSARIVILSKLDRIEDPIDIEVKPLEGQQGVTKTYAFARGHFAKIWALNQGAQFWHNPLVVFRKDQQGNVKDMASLPGLQYTHTRLDWPENGWLPAHFRVT